MARAWCWLVHLPTLGAFAASASCTAATSIAAVPSDAQASGSASESGTDDGGGSSGSGATDSSGTSSNVDSCSPPSDSCCCENDVVTTPTCNADGSLGCGAGFTLHQGSVCACSTPGVCCTAAPDGGPSCPVTPPVSGQTCSRDGATCHYSIPQGETDCGCAGGAWQCYSGCSPSTATSPVDPVLCTPQLQTATTCNPYSGVCGFTVALPCSGDGGTPVGDLDAGASQCTDWCKTVAPPNGPSQVQCNGVDLVTTDGGAVLVAHCNGCGA